MIKNLKNQYNKINDEIYLEEFLSKFDNQGNYIVENRHYPLFKLKVYALNDGSIYESRDNLVKEKSLYKVENENIILDFPGSVALTILKEERPKNFKIVKIGELKIFGETYPTKSDSLMSWLPEYAKYISL